MAVKVVVSVLRRVSLLLCWRPCCYSGHAAEIQNAFGREGKPFASGPGSFVYQA